MDCNKMKVSVVIPAHNEESNIADTIRAVLNQDYHDFEVIVVDNASVDKTGEVASAFPVTVVREDRKGLLWARERGRTESTGDIIANIDADCLPERDWISRGVGHFEHPRVAAVSGPYDYYDAHPVFRLSSLLTQKYIYRPVNRILQMKSVRRGATLIGGNNFIRASALEKAGGYDTSIVFYGAACEALKSGASKNVQIIFGCGDSIIN